MSNQCPRCGAKYSAVVPGAGTLYSCGSIYSEDGFERDLDMRCLQADRDRLAGEVERYRRAFEEACDRLAGYANPPGTACMSVEELHAKPVAGQWRDYILPTAALAGKEVTE